MGNENPTVSFLLRVLQDLRRALENNKNANEVLAVMECIVVMFDHFPRKRIEDDEVGICYLYNEVERFSKIRRRAVKALVKPFLKYLETTYPEYHARGFVVDDL